MKKVNKKKKQNKVALVLGGGSARGLAHIGVLEVLEENHIPVDIIVGTSMGALIGGLYAAGSLKEFKEEVLKLSHSRISSLFFSRRFKRMNADNNIPVQNLLKKFTKGKKIEHLGISFSSIATDLRSGKEIFIEKGDLLNAILASIALPGLFRPVELGNRLLVDGGVIDPLPEKHAHLLAEKVITVNAMPRNYVYSNAGNDVFDVLSRAASIMTSNILNLENVINFDEYSKDNLVHIQLDTDLISPFDFYNADKLIEIGRNAAKKNLKNIKKMIKS